MCVVVGFKLLRARWESTHRHTDFFFIFLFSLLHFNLLLSLCFLSLFPTANRGRGKCVCVRACMFLERTSTGQSCRHSFINSSSILQKKHLTYLSLYVSFMNVTFLYMPLYVSLYALHTPYTSIVVQCRSQVAGRRSQVTVQTLETVNWCLQCAWHMSPPYYSVLIYVPTPLYVPLPQCGVRLPRPITPCVVMSKLSLFVCLCPNMPVCSCNVPVSWQNTVCVCGFILFD